MPKKTLLILAVNGIGNAILQSPTINSILATGNYDVDILFRNRAVQAVFEYDGRIRHKFVIPPNLLGRFRLIRQLRCQPYDYSLALYPSNQYLFHLFPFLIGAKNRIVHSYPRGKWRTLSFLPSTTIPAIEGLHDVEQNLHLLGVLGIDRQEKNQELTFSSSPEDETFANRFIQEHNLTQRLIGIHPGCKFKERYRRWPANKFVDMINRLNAEGFVCLLFSGPEEREVVQNIYKSLKDTTKNILVEEMNLNRVGALIAKCQAFLSTDSGLGHIAVTKHVKTLAIFGPAQFSRTAPYGKFGYHIALPLPCSPCLKYPIHATHSRIRCPFQFKCLHDLDVEKVFAKLMGIINSP